jgi:hypothetical protein
MFSTAAWTTAAEVALSRTEAEKLRDRMAAEMLATLKTERAAEVAAKSITLGDKTLRWLEKEFGDAPEGKRSLWISMHGGGNAPAELNDQQWRNQIRLYQLKEGIYIAPRAPTNTWNLWHEGHIDRMFSRLIENLIVLEDVNPDRVYVLGYSAGGDGVYQLAPRMADHWAAAAMMAGHPNGVPLLSLRNVPFALQVGANDGAYNRNKIGTEYGQMLDALQKSDPKGYQHFVKIHEGKGHWMNLEDKAALPWMAKFQRDSIPERVVWKQSGAAHDRSYWLAVPADKVTGGSLITAQRAMQTIEITSAENVATVLVRLDDRMLDLDKPVSISFGGKVLHNGIAPRTIGTLIKTLANRGDPKLIFDSEISVSLPVSK